MQMHNPVIFNLHLQQASMDCPVVKRIPIAGFSCILLTNKTHKGIATSKPKCSNCGQLHWITPTR